jgi:hypothetical protein
MCVGYHQRHHFFTIFDSPTLGILSRMAVGIDLPSTNTTFQPFPPMNFSLALVA